MKQQFAAALLVALALDAAAFGPPPIYLTPVAGGLSFPTEIAHAGDGSNRLFVTEQAGAIKVIRNGTVLPTPFLDLTAKTEAINERGLLGLAFHPQYASNRRFFVFYTTAADGSLQVSEFKASLADPDRADPASERPILNIPHPLGNHNGGKLAFGPDGYLYIGTGDGGGAFDPGGNAQNTFSLLGKILRISVAPSIGYAIPPENPFVAGGGSPEVLMYGLRNPWRFSFDRQTGDLYIGDVGQNTMEEIDVVPREYSGGVHQFGWPQYEGSLCVAGPGACPPAPRPAIEYRHDDPLGGTSVTGGLVYRGMRSPGLNGWYIYGDFGSNRVWAARRVPPVNSSQLGDYYDIRILADWTSVNMAKMEGISTFGEDEQGEVYVASIRDGRIYMIDSVYGSHNVALASAGAVASASSQYSAAFAPSAAIDGERAGRRFGAGSGWNDATPGAYPDWLQVTFNGMQRIDRVAVYSMQDDPFDPVEPIEGMTFRNYGVQDFTVEGWTGTAWITLARVAGNTLVRRVVEFPAIFVDRIFINVTRALGGYSHITEVEAWTPSARIEVNAAQASSGAVAWASSTYSAAFPASATIDGDRAGRGWGSGSGWNDGTFGAYPDWLQVHFGGMRTLDRVVVYTLQDAVTAPIEPTDYTSFTSYGIRDFTVEGWTGTSWVMLGSVSGNSNVKRTLSFPPVDVDRIFINVTGALGGYSHITEVEAWAFNSVTVLPGAGP